MLCFQFFLGLGMPGMFIQWAACYR